MTSDTNNTWYWISTYTGKKFCFEHIKPDKQIAFEDICQSLSMIPRFNGHITRHYSVAEHSLNVSNILLEPLKLDGLLHDFPEAYTGDMVSPWKALLNAHSNGFVSEIEEGILKAIYGSINRKLPTEEDSETIKHADRVCCVAEAMVLQPKANIKEWGWDNLDELKKEAHSVCIRNQGISNSAIATMLKQAIQELM